VCDSRGDSEACHVRRGVHIYCLINACAERKAEHTLAHVFGTEVPEALRGKGMASALTESALEWAREHQVKVDVICPYVAGYLKKHPEYSDLLLK
jgi:predicted GNAT family acetyltransferase